MPMPDGLSDIVIADRLSDANQVRIRGTSELKVSWELSYAGQLSCVIPLTDLRGYGFQPLDLKGKWIHYEHPTAGPWGGKITNVSGADGIIAINAESWAIELQGVPTQRSLSDSYGLVGELRRQIDLARPETGISAGVFDFGGTDVMTTGEPVEEQDLYESFIPSVFERWEDRNGWQIDELHASGWNIDPITRVFNFDGTYGIDRSGSVGFLDGRHTSHSEFADDLQDVVNRVHITGTVNYQYTETVAYRNDRGQKRQRQVIRSGTKTHHAIATNEISKARYGLRALTVQEDYPSESRMNYAAIERTKYLARPEWPVTVACADVGGLWAKFREGDMCAVDMALSGVRGKMIVRSRALDVGRGVMTVSGEADLG